MNYKNEITGVLHNVLFSNENDAIECINSLINIFEKNQLRSGIFDINGTELKVGDKIKYNNFYFQTGNSEEWFRTEPENSFPVSEAYIEELTSEIYFDYGSFCIKQNNQLFSIKEVVNTNISMLKIYKDISSKSDYQSFLNESVFEDKAASEDDVLIIFKQFEIISND